MSIDFQPAIFDFLSQRRSVDLPGLGRLQWEEVLGRKGASEQIWIPPAIQLKYWQGVQSSEIFLDHLSTSLRIPFSDVKVLWQNWLDDVEKELNDSGRYRIDHVGIFNKVAGGSMVFTPDAAFQNGAFYTPDITAEKVSRPAEVVQEPQVDEEGAINWLAAFGTAILILLLLSAIVLLSTSVISQLNGNSVSHGGEIKELPESGPATGKAVPEANSGVPVDSDSTEEQYVEEILKEEGAGQQLETVSGKSCIIIVGSFKNMDYARTVEATVIDMGYKLYTEPYNGYHRVGIEFDCLTQDLYRTLFRMKGRFGDDAWILKYEK